MLEPRKLEPGALLAKPALGVVAFQGISGSKLQMIDHRFERYKSVEPAALVAKADGGFVRAVQKPNVFCWQGACVDEQIAFAGVEDCIGECQRKRGASEVCHGLNVP